MIIGIDASRAYLRNRTGIEEYSYQVIKHLTKYLTNCKVVLYLRKSQEGLIQEKGLGFNLPANWQLKYLWAPRLWTQLRLSWELLIHPIDVLFVPAHTIPFWHPKKTAVTIHGLEYEFCPQAYSKWERFYMRFSIRNSCRWAKNVIAVSENTKKDLKRLYNVPEDKIKVIYEGYTQQVKSEKLKVKSEKQNLEKEKFPYFLFIGRLEKRKNIVGIIKAFEILKEKYKLPHRLFLLGKLGYGGKEISKAIENSKYSSDINAPGYVKEKVKNQILSSAAVFLFPTYYEGFGLPILEAQNAGVSVVASNFSSVPEVVGNPDVLVNPHDTGQIADKTYKIITNQDFCSDIIKKGYENISRFSWDKCAAEIAKILN